MELRRTEEGFETSLCGYGVVAVFKRGTPEILTSNGNVFYARMGLLVGESSEREGVRVGVGATRRTRCREVCDLQKCLGKVVLCP